MKKDDFSHPCIDPVVILLRDSASYIRTSSYAVGFNHHQWNNSYMQSVYRQAWKTIHATLQLWQGRTMIDSWSGNGTSYLLITGSHEVTKGKHIQ